jgi:hypothetical protein
VIISPLDFIPSYFLLYISPCRCLFLLPALENVLIKEHCSERRSHEDKIARVVDHAIPGWNKSSWIMIWDHSRYMRNDRFALLAAHENFVLKEPDVYTSSREVEN